MGIKDLLHLLLLEPHPSLSEHCYQQLHLQVIVNQVLNVESFDSSEQCPTFTAIPLSPF